MQRLVLLSVVENSLVQSLFVSNSTVTELCCLVLILNATYAPVTLRAWLSFSFKLTERLNNTEVIIT